MGWFRISEGDRELIYIASFNIDLKNILHTVAGILCEGIHKELFLPHLSARSIFLAE